MNFLINTIFAESEKMTAEGKTHHLKYIPRIFELRADPTKATVNELMDLYAKVQNRDENDRVMNILDGLIFTGDIITEMGISSHLHTQEFLKEMKKDRSKINVQRLLNTQKLYTNLLA